MQTRLGYFGCFLRIFLGVVNLLVLAIGIALIICTSVFKWSNVLTSIRDSPALGTIIDLTAVDSVVIALLVIGCVLVVVSLVGFLATATLNRVLLGVYEIVLFIIFLGHLGVFIALLVLSPRLEDNVNAKFNDLAEQLSGNLTSTVVQINDILKLTTDLSSTFTCCGIRGPSDFQSPDLLLRGCKDSSVQVGCATKIIDFLKIQGVYVLVIPSSIILFFELITILFVPYLFYKVSQAK